VSKPEIRSPQEAAAYLRAFRAVLVYLGVCDGNMEEGSLRCDANVSLKPAGAAQLGTKVEIKNMNSFRNVQRALEFEVARQTDALERGERIAQAKVTPSRLAGLLRLIDDGTISGKIAKTVFETMVRTGEDAIAIVRREGLTQVADAGALASMVASAIAGNPRAVEDYRKGKT